MTVSVVVGGASGVEVSVGGRGVEVRVGASVSVGGGRVSVGGIGVAVDGIGVFVGIDSRVDLELQPVIKIRQHITSDKMVDF